MSSPVRLTGGAYTAHNVIASAQRSLNLYSEPMPQGEGEPAPAANYPTPGTRLLGAVGTGPIRCIRQASNGNIYVVSGDNVYSVDATTWVGASRGSLTAGLKTPVSMVDNGLDMLIVDGTSSGWAINLAANTMAPVVDPTGMFVGADRVDYLDTFFLLNKPGTPQFYISGSLALTFDPLDFANKEAYSDLLVTLIVARREVYLLGTKTSEIWYDVGASSPTDTAAFQFAPVQGVFVDHGCVAKYSAASYDNTVFWLSRNRQGRGVVMTSAGYQTKRVSTYAIEAELQTYPRIDDAIGFCYQIAGHTFYVLTFPHADHTWCYDVGTGLWHEWAWIDSNGDEHRHRANAFWPCNDTLVVGDWQNGNLYALDQNVFTDAGQAVGGGLALARSGDAYHASAVHFDGSTVLSNEALASTDNAYIGVSVWCQADDLSTSPSIFVADPNGNYATFFGLTPLGALISSAANADASSLVQFNTADATLNDTNWHHFIVALRSDDGGIPGQILAAVYMDDIPLVNAGGHPPDPFSTIATNGLLMTVGGDPFGDNFIGNIADLRIMPGINLLDGTGLAISEATRRLFIDADGKPVDPAVATAALGAPCVLFSGPPPALGRSTSFIDNLGTGGAFTLAGTLTEAPTSPSGAAPAPGAPTVSPIKRLRTYPHLITDARRVFYREFIADMDVGNAPQMLVEEIIPPPPTEGWAYGWTVLPIVSPDLGGDAFAISTDAQTVVGDVDVPATPPFSAHAACYWTPTSGPNIIGPTGSVAYGVCGDGSIIVGSEDALGAFIWTTTSGYSAFDTSGSTAYAISSDGSRIVGSNASGPCYWDTATLSASPIPLPTGYAGGWATAASRDGSVIVGYTQITSGDPTYSNRAFVWTAADGAIILPMGTALSMRGWSVSGDGSYVIGDAHGGVPGSASGNGSFTWTAGGGTILVPALDDLTTGKGKWGFGAISDDGSTILSWVWWPDVYTSGSDYIGYTMVTGSTLGPGVAPTPLQLDPSADINSQEYSWGGINGNGQVLCGYAQRRRSGQPDTPEQPGYGYRDLPLVYYIPQPSRVTIPAASNNLISLRWSDDRGHSYGSLVSQPIGAAGEYRKSLQWQRLGMARDRVFEISWSTPMATALQGAWLTAEVADADTPPKEQGE